MAVHVVRALVLCLAIVGLLCEQGEALPSCFDIKTLLLPCLEYVRGQSTAPSSICCNGVQVLNNEAATRADRQTVCECVQQAVPKFPGIKENLAAGLPQKCGVQSKIPIKRNLDCSKIP